MVSKEFKWDLFSLEWSPKGDFLIAGDDDGSIHSINATSLEEVNSVKHQSKCKGDTWVQDLKISPEGDKVVFGVHGGTSSIEVCSIT